jgi:hypothetical protein
VPEHHQRVLRVADGASQLGLDDLVEDLDGIVPVQVQVHEASSIAASVRLVGHATSAVPRLPGAARADPVPAAFPNRTLT